MPTIGAWVAALLIWFLGSPASEAATTVADHSVPGAVAEVGTEIDWSNHQFDLANTGHNPFETVLDAGNVGTLELKWSVDLGNSLGANTTPVLRDGVLYAGTSNYPSDLYALDPGSGEILWSQPLDYGLETPSVTGNTIYITAAQGAVYALRRQDGAERWAFKTIGGVYDSPAVVGGTVYVGSNDQNFYALDARTGEVRWQRTLGFLSSNPAIADGSVYVATTLDGVVFALDASTGDIVWDQSLDGSAIDASPVLAQGRLFIATDGGHLFALNAATGDILWWRGGFGNVGLASAAVADGVVYQPSSDHGLAALNAATGQVLWFSPKEGLATVPVIVNGVVYAGSTDSNLYAFDAASGRILWSFAASGSVTTPIVVNGSVYVASFDNHLYAFGLP